MARVFRRQSRPLFLSGRTNNGEPEMFRLRRAGRSVLAGVAVAAAVAALSVAGTGTGTASATPRLLERGRAEPRRRADHGPRCRRGRGARRAPRHRRGRGYPIGRRPAGRSGVWCRAGRYRRRAESAWARFAATCPQRSRCRERSRRRAPARCWTCSPDP